MRLSPHFLKKNAHKALEWLVRKWRVNEIFVDELLISILPYHDTVPFVRMVQIVYFADDSRWMFLFDKVKQGGYTVTRKLLAQRCTIDNTLLSQVMRGFSNTTAHIKQHPDYCLGRTFISFTTYLLLETMDAMKSIDDQACIRLYQRIEEMIKVPESPEAVTGAMMVFMALSDRVPLSDAALNFFMRKIAKLATLGIEWNVLQTVIRTVEMGYLEKFEPSTAICIARQSGMPSLAAELKATYFPKLLLEALQECTEDDAASLVRRLKTDFNL